jgi:hypothetical protein
MREAILRTLYSVLMTLIRGSDPGQEAVAKQKWPTARTLRMGAVTDEAGANPAIIDTGTQAPRRGRPYNCIQVAWSNGTCQSTWLSFSSHHEPIGGCWPTPPTRAPPYPLSVSKRAHRAFRPAQTSADEPMLLRTTESDQRNERTAGAWERFEISAHRSAVRTSNPTHQ